MRAIVDSHVHLWDPRRFRMPWLDDIDPLRQPFGLDTFAEHARGLPIDRLVYVQVDTTPAYGLLEARWAAQQDLPVAGIVAWAPMEDGRVVTSLLDALKEVGPRIKGTRRLLQTEPAADVLEAAVPLVGLRVSPVDDL